MRVSIPGKPRHVTVAMTVAMAAAAYLVACAPFARTRSPARVTSAEMAGATSPPPEDAEASSRFESVLALAERAVQVAPENAWGHYDRAVALHHLRRTDEAVEAYREAEVRFGDARWGRSIAIYGRARALDEAGRCDEASVAYEEYAALVQASDPEAADLARTYAPLCRAARGAPPDTVTSNVAVAVVARDYARALALANDSPDVKDDRRRPWLDYNRGVALAELQRTDEAVQAFRSAERGFSETGEPEHEWGRSVAIYGRARALDAAGRCAEAKKAYEEYASLVNDRASADVALAVADRCDAP